MQKNAAEVEQRGGKYHTLKREAKWGENRWGDITFSAGGGFAEL